MAKVKLLKDYRGTLPEAKSAGVEGKHIPKGKTIETSEQTAQALIKQGIAENVKQGRKKATEEKAEKAPRKTKEEKQPLENKDDEPKEEA